MRLILYLLLFSILYFIIKLVIKSLSSQSKTSVNNARMNRKGTNYENIEDAKFTEIKPDEEKKNNP
ncbi:MAG TPA: hypothetical protein VLN45_13460 [Ignavibacteriaceae bacterium]|nr:hypothetical protein [Ignavibacteriaceae bacterium]